MAENLDVNVNVNTTNAQRSVDNLIKSVTGLQNSFGKLRTALAGGVLGAFATSTLRMADAVTDLATATGLSTAQVLAFNQAIKENGGDAQAANSAIEKFAVSLEDARNGSKDAQDALQEAGLTLKEISNLKPGDAFSAYVKGLGQIEGETKKIANASTILGKGVRSVDFQAVANSIDQYTISNAKAAIEAEKVGQMVDNLGKAASELQKVLLTVLQPIANFINWLSEGGSAAKTFLVILASIATVIGGGWILKGVQGLISFVKYIGAATGGVASFRNMVASVSVTMAGLFGLINIDPLKEFLGFQTSSQKKAEEQAKAQAKLAEQLAKARKEAEAQELQMKRASAAIENAATKQIEATKKTITQYNEQFSMQTKLMSATEEQKTVVTTMYDLQQRKIAALLPLQEKLRELQSIPAGARGATDAAEMTATQNAITNITKQYDAQLPVVTKLVQERVNQMILEKDLLRNADLLTQAYEAQASVEEEMRGISLGSIEKIMKMEQDYALSILPEQARIMQEIANTQNEIGLAAKRKVATQFENDPMGLAQAMKNIDTATQTAIKLQQEAAEKNYEQTNSFETGWTKAWNSYAENATNASKIAGDAMNAVTSNMNSAIDNFVNNGKFKFSDFAKSVIQDLIKIELKSQASKLLSGASGFLGSLFGGFFANGGQPPVGKPSIVGENGPELFVPRTAGTIIPNGGSAGTSAAGGNTYITNNINAVDAKSVAQLFAENRKTLFGTVEMARKEMSYSR